MMPYLDPYKAQEKIDKLVDLLTLAGKLATSAHLVGLARPLELSARIKEMNVALDQYDEAILQEVTKKGRKEDE